MISFVHYDFVCWNSMNYYYCVMNVMFCYDLKLACRTILFEFDFLIVFQLDFTFYLIVDIYFS